MGILKRIKNRLPIVGGGNSASRPASTHRPTPPMAAAERPAPPPPKDPETVRAEIDAAVQSNKVIVFMKGTRHAPQCGFSAAAVDVFEQLGMPFETLNVLSDPGFRQGIKDYSDWPTIPQIYVGGEFVGGSDIVREMFENGELKTLLQKTFETE